MKASNHSIGVMLAALLRAACAGDDETTNSTGGTSGRGGTAGGGAGGTATGGTGTGGNGGGGPTLAQTAEAVTLVRGDHETTFASAGGRADRR